MLGGSEREKNLGQAAALLKRPSFPSPQLRQCCRGCVKGKISWMLEAREVQNKAVSLARAQAPPESLAWGVGWL